MTKGIKHKDIGQELTEVEWEADDSHELESGTSFPGSPTEKDRYYRSDEHKWYIYNGTEWKALGGTDISDADAVVGEVKDGKFFYSVEEPIKEGTMPTVAVAPGSSAYPAGYHAGDGGGLPAIDADLVTGNIKATITIFNILGHTDVRNVSDADLVEAEAPTGKTFYAVGGARKTGSGTKTLSPANETVAAGYYVATTLSTVDGDLDPANIKSGITIFGKAGSTNVRDVTDANALIAEVKSGRTFYAVGGARKTGTMPTVAIVAANDNYPAGYHAGHGGGLDAIDVQLAPANIKSGVNIFGKVGTHVGGPLAEDIIIKQKCDFYRYDGADNCKKGRYSASIVVATTTQTFAANSLAFAVAQIVAAETSGSMELRLEMDGVVMAGTAMNSTCKLSLAIATKALVGSKTCLTRIYEISSAWCSIPYMLLSPGGQNIFPCSISVGSIKL